MAAIHYKRRNSMNTNYNFPSNGPLEPAMDEIAMIQLSQKGDREMFAHLYESYVERIYRYVYHRVDDNMVAEDITSQIFLKVWEKLGTYRTGQAPFLSWIYRIAHNTVIDHYRTKKVVIFLEDAKSKEPSYVDGTDEKLDLQEQSQHLQEALQALTIPQQQVLMLKFTVGLNTSEIARKLGKQEGAVRALQMRGLQGLSKCRAIQREEIYT
jgi:RNA polymerase sigma-70 factor (ECF subfamily)